MEFSVEAHRHQEPKTGIPGAFEEHTKGRTWDISAVRDKFREGETPGTDRERNA